MLKKSFSLAIRAGNLVHRPYILSLGVRNARTDFFQEDFDQDVVRLAPGSTKHDEGRTFPFTALHDLADLLRRQWDRTMVLHMEKDT